jgi:xanthine/CO dehydrogenase XdhC/CoxF family maturation factor
VASKPIVPREKLVLPEPLKSIRRQSRVTDGRVDRLVPEVVLDCTGVLAVVCELVAAGMPQHVTVNEEAEARGLASPRDPCADTRQRLGVPGAH